MNKYKLFSLLALASVITTGSSLAQEKSYSSIPSYSRQTTTSGDADPADAVVTLTVTRTEGAKDYNNPTYQISGENLYQVSGQNIVSLQPGQGLVVRINNANNHYSLKYADPIPTSPGTTPCIFWCKRSCDKSSSFLDSNEQLDDYAGDPLTLHFCQTSKISTLNPDILTFSVYDDTTSPYMTRLRQDKDKDHSYLENFNYSFWYYYYSEREYQFGFKIVASITIKVESSLSQ